MRAYSILMVLAATSLVSGCKKADTSPATATGSTADPGLALIGCDHEVKSNTVANHSWPYPADYRNFRWTGRYDKTSLKLKPNHASFVTATVTWKEGDLILVEDSYLRITKPRRLVAKRDLFVKRKVWDQGIQVERTFLAAAEGELGSFLFYNSRGLCLVGTEGGPGWTECTLDDAFEGLSAEHPHACEQVWWVKVRKSKVNQGWMIVDPNLVERIPLPSDAAK